MQHRPLRSGLRPDRALPESRRRRWRNGLLLGAAGLGGLAIANHLLARRSEARHPPEGKFVTVDGVRLHYREAGEGPDLVLLHGNGVASDDFVVSGLMGLFSRTHRVIAFDRPGFGYSERPRDVVWTPATQARLLLRALEALGLDRPVLLGHSWGTLVAAEMALAAPDAFSALVLVSGYYRPTPRVDSLLLAGPAVPVAGDVMRFTVSPILGRLLAPAVLRHVFAPAPVTDRFRRGYPVSQSVRPSQVRASAAESGLLIAAAAHLAPRVAELRPRTLIVAGADDKLIRAADQSAWLAEQLDQAQYVAIEGAGHMVHHTAPETVAAALEAFVYGGPAATASLDGRPAAANP